MRVKDEAWLKVVEVVEVVEVVVEVVVVSMGGGHSDDEGYLRSTERDTGQYVFTRESFTSRWDWVDVMGT